MAGDKIKVKLQEDWNRYVKVNIKDKDKKYKSVHMHGYLIGLSAALKLKKNNNWASLVIITGNVGDGKSSFTELYAGTDAQFNNTFLTMDSVAWKTDKFIEKTDRDDNFGTNLWWDEAIQGAGSRSMALSNEGNKLKMAFVTKRFKKHTYFLLIDEINEYSWKLVKMADAWINIKKFGIQRGYFDAYTHRNKIQYLYDLFKEKKKTWNSPLVRAVKPDCKGKFNNGSGLFLDEEEYNKMKLEETQQSEEDKKTVSIDPRAFKVKELRDKGEKWFEISQQIGSPESTIKGWYKKLSALNPITNTN